MSDGSRSAWSIGVNRRSPILAWTILLTWTISLPAYEQASLEFSRERRVFDVWTVREEEFPERSSFDIAA